MTTVWTSRENVSTNWDKRQAVNTDWDGRKQPIRYYTPLQDAYRIVHDQDDQIIYIFGNDGKPISWNIWTERQPVL